MTCAIALVIAVCLYMSRLWNHWNATVRDGYSQQVAVTFLKMFMDENDGKWPKSWNCLESIFERELKRGYASPGEFEELKQRIFIDFNADIDRMREESLTSDKPAFRVVYAKFTSGFHPIADPNYIIHYYLRERALELDKE